MNETLQAWAIVMGCIVGVSVFLRFCPKEKLLKWIRPKAFAAGLFVSRSLTMRIGKKACEKVEEGVIVTLANVLSEAIGKFVDGLISDNEKQKKARVRK